MRPCLKETKQDKQKLQKDKTEDPNRQLFGKNIQMKKHPRAYVSNCGTVTVCPSSLSGWLLAKHRQGQQWKRRWRGGAITHGCLRETQEPRYRGHGSLVPQVMKHGVTTHSILL